MGSSSFPILNTTSDLFEPSFNQIFVSRTTIRQVLSGRIGPSRARQVSVAPEPLDRVADCGLNRAAGVVQLADRLGTIVVLHVREHLHEETRNGGRSPEDCLEGPFHHLGPVARQREGDRRQRGHDPGHPGDEGIELLLRGVPVAQDVTLPKPATLGRQYHATATSRTSMALTLPAMYRGISRLAIIRIWVPLVGLLS